VLPSSICSARRAQRDPARRNIMVMEIGHVHIKTYDPKKTAQFYIDNFGATLKNEAPNGNIQLNLHGLQLNVTTISAAQNRKQMMGIEHIAVQTDDYASAIAKLRSNGAHVMLEQFNNGRHVAFIEAPDGAQMELIEKV
jgi:catechol 2,3-dioxygenase-like lactoylglutathione lyase family enzyme